jgi:hypothetical protein
MGCLRMGETIGQRPALYSAYACAHNSIWQSCYCCQMSEISVKPTGAYSIDYDHFITYRYWDFVVLEVLVHDM